MSMKEKIRIHAEIERENKRKVNRWKAKELYRQFCRNGQFWEGRRVLELLQFGSVTLRLNDADWNVQEACEKAGFYIWFSRNGNKAEAHI